MEDLFHGKDIILIGSAPCIDRKLIRPDHFTVGVNGSLAALPGAVLDVIFINGWTAAPNSDVAKASLAAFNGRRCNSLVVVTAAVSFGDILDRLREAGLQWKVAYELDAICRRSLVENALGRVLESSAPKHTASTGVSAMLAIIQGGVSSLTVTGVSLQGGHSYLTGTTPRHHADVDAEVIAKTGVKLEGTVTFASGKYSGE